MADRVVECACGQKMRLPERAVSGRGRCIRCGAIIRVGQDASRVEGAPLPTDVRHATIDRLEALWGDDEAPKPTPHATTPTDAMRRGTLPAADPMPEPRCARCGRAFRGDWDQRPGEEGTLCLICARQSPEPTPWDAPPAGPPVPPPGKAELREFRTIQERLEKEQQPKQDRRGLVPFLIFSGFVMLLILVFPVEVWLNRATLAIADRQVEEVSPDWRYALMAVRLLIVYLSFFLPVYLTFREAGKLDDDSFLANFLYTNKYAFGFFLVEALFRGFAEFGGGPGANVFALVYAFSVPALILWVFSDLTGREVFHFYIYLCIIKPAMIALQWPAPSGASLVAVG